MNDTAYDAMIRPLASAYGAEIGVDADTMAALVKAVIRQESAFNPAAFRAEPRINDASRGLMQVLARTARALGYSGDVGNDATHVGGLYDPYTSIRLGTKLLAANLRQARGDFDVAISAYNAGFSTARPWDGNRASLPNGPFVNQAYVNAVRAYFAEYLTQTQTAAAMATVGNGVTDQGVGGANWTTLVTVGGAILGGIALWLLFRGHP